MSSRQERSTFLFTVQWFSRNRTSGCREGVTRCPWLSGEAAVTEQGEEGRKGARRKTMRTFATSTAARKRIRWRIARDVQEMKDELGLDHYEG